MSRGKPVDLREASSPIGRVIGELKILENGPRAKGSKATYVCQCSCGSPPKVIRWDHIQSKRIISCNRCRSWSDLTDRTFDRWKVLREAGVNEYGHRLWLCQCKCGSAPKPVTVYALLNGSSGSCGCLNAELSQARSTTHGMTGTTEYRRWQHILNRCENPNVPAYKNYGGRGITVCLGWHSFEAFFADMGPVPTPEHEIDRKDNNKGYWCGRCEECVSNGRIANCRWATVLEQARNRRDNVKANYQGKMLCVAELASLPECLVSGQTISRRLAKGWSAEKAITTPPEVPVPPSRGRRKPLVRQRMIQQSISFEPSGADSNFPRGKTVTR